MTKRPDRSSVNEKGLGVGRVGGVTVHLYTVHNVGKAWRQRTAGTSGPQSGAESDEW